MREELLNILAELHPEVDFASAEDLIGQGIIDSFDIISIVAEVQARLDIRIPAYELTPENFGSADAILAMLERIENE